MLAVILLPFFALLYRTMEKQQESKWKVLLVIEIRQFPFKLLANPY